MSASRMPALRPRACRPRAKLTAVVDLPTPPLPDATAIKCRTPATWAMARGAAGAGACLARARPSRTRWLSGVWPPPAVRARSAVSTAVTRPTPSVSATIFSAACRKGSSSSARAAGTVMEKDTRPSLMRTSETRPRSTMLLSRSGPLTRRRRSRICSRLRLIAVSLLSRQTTPAAAPASAQAYGVGARRAIGTDAVSLSPRGPHASATRPAPGRPVSRCRPALASAPRGRRPAALHTPLGETFRLSAAPKRQASFTAASERFLALLDHHVGVVGVVRQLQPQVLVAAEGADRVPDLLEVLVLGTDAGIDLVGGLEADVEDGLRERPQLRAVGHQPLQRLRVLRIVAAEREDVGLRRRHLEDGLVGRRQLFPFLLVDVDVDHGAAFPPARVVVELGDLVEAQLLVVVRADPFGGVDGALLERGIDVAAGNLLRHHAHLRHHLAGKAGNAHLHALEIVGGVELLAEPAAHLGPGIAGEQADDVMLGIKSIDLLIATLAPPRVLHAGIEAEGHRAAQRKGRVLAPQVVGSGVAQLDAAGRNRVGGLQARHDFAGGKGLHLKLVVGACGDAFGEVFRPAVERVERLRPARRHAPLEFRCRLRNGRRGQTAGHCRGSGRARGLQEFTTIHACHVGLTSLKRVD